jgi:HSP20 family protein
MTLAPFFSRRRRGGGQLAATPTYRRDPYREMEDINDQFGQLVQGVFGMTPGLAAPAAWSALAVPVDVEETDDAYIVDVDLPNVNPEDVNIEMRGEELRITGQFQDRDRTGVLRRQNRPTGDFEYVVDLPSDIDPNRVEATYDNGVLTVTVGKARDAQPRRIEISGTQGRQQAGRGDKQREGQRERQREEQQTTAAEGQKATKKDGQQA